MSVISELVNKLRWIADYEYQSRNSEDTIRRAADTIEMLSEKARGQEWIPCSERLPELGENVLATCLMFDDYRDIGIYTRQWTSDHSEIRWFSDDEYGQLFDCDVVAWMPLPKPWKGADDETD